MGNQEQELGTTSLGTSPKVLAGLSYLLAPITSLIIFLLEKENRFVRFHSAQGLILFGGWFVISFVVGLTLSILAHIPVLGGLVGGIIALLWAGISFIVSIVLFVLWIVLMVKGFTGQYYKLPLIGEYAEKMLG